MANDVDGVEQLKAPAETGEREMNSKRRAAAEEEETTLVKDAMIDRSEGYNKNGGAPAEVEQNFCSLKSSEEFENGVGGGSWAEPHIVIAPILA